MSSNTKNSKVSSLKRELIACEESNGGKNFTKNLY